MSAHTPEEIRKETRTYIVVFAALATLTVITVVVSYLDLPTGAAVFVALFIALIKGSLVVAYFMHLIDEQRVIYAILLFTLVLFIVIFALPAGNFADQLQVD